MSDVVFFIGPNKDMATRVPAHKFVLAAASPPFKAMFASDFEENKTNEVVITDIDVASFMQMLK